MFSLKSLWKPWMGDATKPPERDERMMVADSLLLELEYHIKESEQLIKDREQEERRRQTGVDYSWLVNNTGKAYEVPQLERLELEELCYKVKPQECSKVISLFRDSMLNEPKLQDISKIFKACIRQVIEQRPKEETLTDWVIKRTVSLSSLKLRPISKITPYGGTDCDETDSNSTIETVSSIVDQGNSSVLYLKPSSSKSCDLDSLPV